ncbi:Rv3654c family TadE-like protein [Aeromicrobium sp. CTD01-1L150]|uniref:Rv3654c family TadE-like protein n=1 Tax=Aeromicrobium sp. CTD01-1L150 TaxID=3341830 RepID=UPI0035BF0D3F
MRSSERGVVSAHAVWVVTAITVVALLAVQVAALVQLRHRAASAADLSALAASRASVAGQDGCRAAEDIARRNGAHLQACRMDLDVATVTTRLASTPWWGGEWVTTQDARAAPTSYVDP